MYYFDVLYIDVNFANVTFFRETLYFVMLDTATTNISPFDIVMFVNAMLNFVVGLLPLSIHRFQHTIGGLGKRSELEKNE